MVKFHGKTFGLVPYGLRPLSLKRARRAFWNAEDARFLASALFGVGWTTLRSAPRHPLQGLLLVAFVLWRLRAGQRWGR